MIQPAAEQQLATEFAQLRPYLLRVAYSHLGSLSEAEDLVQEAWIRLERTDRAELRNLRAWLTTVVSRLALDALTSARSRRERYVGPWLPEPLVQADPDEADPARRVDLDESVSMALLVVLESLSPAERSAFLLHDVFGYSFNEVAQIVGRTPAAARQLATRGRHAVEARRPRYPAGLEQQREVVSAFQAAAQNGDVGSLIELLDPAVTFRSDGGGVVNAARTVFSGAERVARIFIAMAGHFGDQFRMRPIVVNGAPGLLLETGEYPSVIAFNVDQGRISEIDVVRNPEKLGTVLGSGR
ncbi:MAG TPA: RNA polymerase sigma factor SigJ [Solirubrobacteraceae bacterium]|nr:RNA polymerase sigma factor SigJ [Solirubrobacteraceae bacterium]